MVTWNLNVEGEQRSYKQRLRINPDLSALYGSTLIKKINLDGDKYLYILSDAGVMTCVVAHSGEQVWQGDIGGAVYASPVCVNGRIYIIMLSPSVSTATSMLPTLQG